ncbi:MAG: hypothetical protein U1C33_08125, partial [Candidatus Cloacimonadaceae bacterium]|nr:hypothetical protein [Candidatus Cloacimonadaceae bacterium]
FSVYAYLITFTNLIILKTDQLVISIFGSVAMVAVYQISIRLADTYQRFSAQFLDNLGPVSAALFASGDKTKMTDILLQSNRLMGMISTMLLIPLIVFVKPLLNIWLDLNDTAGTICALILLTSMYILLFFRSSSVYVLLMANEQKVLARVAIIEAIANLGLSILFIHLLPKALDYYGIYIKDSAIIGVALGTFIPNAILAFAFNIPKACRFVGIRKQQYFRIVVWRTLLIGFFTLLFTISLYMLHYPQRLLTILFYCIICAVVYITLTYLVGLEKWEKRQVIGFVNKRLGRA